MSKRLYINNRHVKMFQNYNKYDLYVDYLVANSYEFLERYAHTDMSHYSHKAITNGIKIRKRGE